MAVENAAGIVSSLSRLQGNDNRPRQGLLATVASVLCRYRRATGVERLIGANYCFKQKIASWSMRMVHFIIVDFL